ncbi:MAG: hypothetical protein Q8Q94_04095 [bacterium]|nr:hypothetical protein [bacterium]MDZ4299865.1 hypothetical protein [Candidatus Sungbacteria bacterium]
MNLSRIKQLVKQNGDKLILMEHDEPDVVILSFAEYERLVKRAEGPLPMPVSSPASSHEHDPFPPHYNHNNEGYGHIPDESPLREDRHEPYLPRVADAPSLPAMSRFGSGAERPRTPVHLEDVQLHDLPI